mmetsp:Transcript_96616/g.208460  ORF Transcript_96616/g.208460 Transcript_96616/m.208460 type:complete len:309 (-) Transcript_96616:5-931(-)
MDEDVGRFDVVVDDAFVEGVLTDLPEGAQQTEAHVDDLEFTDLELLVFDLPVHGVVVADFGHDALHPALVVEEVEVALDRHDPVAVRLLAPDQHLTLHVAQFQRVRGRKRVEEHDFERVEFTVLAVLAAEDLAEPAAPDQVEHGQPLVVALEAVDFGFLAGLVEPHEVLDLVELVVVLEQFLFEVTQLLDLQFVEPVGLGLLAQCMDLVFDVSEQGALLDTVAALEPERLLDLELLLEFGLLEGLVLGQNGVALLAHDGVYVGVQRVRDGAQRLVGFIQQHFGLRGSGAGPAVRQLYLLVLVLVLVPF